MYRFLVRRITRYRLLTDFNDINDGIVTGLESCLTGRRPRMLKVGDRIRLHDDGEHEAWGVVTDVNGGIIAARIDWDTWEPQSQPVIGC